MEARVEVGTKHRINKKEHLRFSKADKSCMWRLISSWLRARASRRAIEGRRGGWDLVNFSCADNGPGEEKITKGDGPRGEGRNRDTASLLRLA